MRTQILAKLVTKYPGLSKKFLGLIADKLANKVTDDSGIEDAIADLDNAPISIQDLASEFEKEGDRRVGDAKKLWEKNNPPKPKSKTDTDDPDDENDEEEENAPDASARPKKGDRIPKWAQGLISEVQSLRSEKQITSVKSKLKESLKDIPPTFYEEWAIPEKEEELEGFETKVKSKWEAFSKEHPQTQNKGGHQPNRSSGSTETKADAKEVETIVNSII